MALTEDDADLVGHGDSGNDEDNILVVDSGIASITTAMSLQDSHEMLPSGLQLSSGFFTAKLLYCTHHI